jgi:hypothetical protein
VPRDPQHSDSGRRAGGGTTQLLCQTPAGRGRCRRTARPRAALRHRSASLVVGLPAPRSQPASGRSPASPPGAYTTSTSRPPGHLGAAVENQLQRVYEKLGVTGRHQLAARHTPCLSRGGEMMPRSVRRTPVAAIKVRDRRCRIAGQTWRRSAPGGPRGLLPASARRMCGIEPGQPRATGGTPRLAAMAPATVSRSEPGGPRTARRIGAACRCSGGRQEGVGSLVSDRFGDPKALTLVHPGTSTSTSSPASAGAVAMLTSTTTVSCKRELVATGGTPARRLVKQLGRAARGKEKGCVRDG